MTAAESEQFWSNVQATEGCWPWGGPIMANGYGRFTRARLAHRFAFEDGVGPIPDGLWLDHLCRNRCCVNPAHLEAVTPQENVLRGIGISAINAKKTHCKRGHQFDAENTRFVKHGRKCIACEKLANPEYHRRRMIKRAEARRG